MRAWVAHRVLVVVVRQMHIVCIAAPGKLQRRNTPLRKASSDQESLSPEPSHTHFSHLVLAHICYLQECALLTKRSRRSQELHLMKQPAYAARAWHLQDHHARRADGLPQRHHVWRDHAQVLRDDRHVPERLPAIKLSTKQRH